MCLSLSYYYMPDKIRAKGLQVLLSTYIFQETLVHFRKGNTKNYIVYFSTRRYSLDTGKFLSFLLFFWSYLPLIIHLSFSGSQGAERNCVMAQSIWNSLTFPG